jgi:hypothetical protein
MMGYLHPLYAQSLAQYGRPRILPESGGGILERPIPGSAYHDAMGFYPLFCCEKWSRLEVDLTSLGEDLVSVAVVVDPFGDVAIETLGTAFDFVRPFKEHFISDLSLPYASLANKHHRYEARRALRTVTVELDAEPLPHLDVWNDLYQHLVDKHGLRGIKAFSREAFYHQLSIPGVVMLRALYNGQTVSAQLWFQQGEVAYYHLSASNAEGYRWRAAYALSACAIEYFTSRVRYLDFGGAPGLSDSDGGLAAFKRGWSSGTRPSYFCGRILNRRAYAELMAGRKPSAYFPEYRDPEMS